MDDTLVDHRESVAPPMNAPDMLAPPNPPAESYDNDGHLRKPPYSQEAEQSVLGALMLDNGTFAAVSETLGAGDFFRHEHKLIFGAIAQLMGQGKPADVVTVYEQLGDQAETAGNLAYINALLQGVNTSANVQRHAEIVAERAARRAVIAAATVTLERAFSPEGTAARLLDDAKVSFARIAEQRKVGSAQRIPFLSLDQLSEHSQAIKWLVKHVVPMDSIGMFFGGSGTFKSFIALDFALHVAHGLPWMGRRTTKGPVIYIAAEGGGGIMSRIEAWHRARRLSWTSIKDSFRVVPKAMDLTADAWRVVEAGQAVGHVPVLVVIDTLSQTYSGEENSANDMAAYFREIGGRMQALWKCTVAIIHHSGHQATERPRGSSAIRANVDWLLGVFRDEKEMLATLTCVKQKDGEPFDDATFSVLVHTLGTDEDGDKVTSLVARHLSSAEELQDVMEVEAKAGRGGNNQLLLSLLQNGSKEADLRKAFYDECDASTPEARRQAYHRAKSWATKKGFFEVVQGHILTLKTGGAA